MFIGIYIIIINIMLLIIINNKRPLTPKSMPIYIYPEAQAVCMPPEIGLPATA